MDVTEQVTRDVADLVPGFLANKRRELGQIEAALKEEDWKGIAFLAERMYASGAPFGFLQMTGFGAALRKAAWLPDKRSIRRTVTAYTDYLDRVRWVLVEPPTLDSIWRRRKEQQIADDCLIVKGSKLGDGSLPGAGPGRPTRVSQYGQLSTNAARNLESANDQSTFSRPLSRGRAG